MDKKYIQYLQNRIAETSIGASSLRNQGAPGVVEESRNYMKHIDLNRLSNIHSKRDYIIFLNRHTGRLMNRFRGNAKGNWGAARKALNLFIRDVRYNVHLNKWFKIGSVSKWLEVPLDRYVINGLKRDNKSNHLENPKWKSIRSLSSEKSNLFQSIATYIANQKNIHRVDLDIEYWRNDKLNF